MVAEMGGPDRVTVKEMRLIKRAVFLDAYADDFEARWYGGEPPPIPMIEYNSAVNTQRRLLATLGLERRSRDVTPTLQEYLASLPKTPVDVEATSINDDETSSESSP
jgi:hypothetical protein